MKKPLSVYLHIPFCRSKCGYCDFLSFAGADSKQEAYTKALVREITESPYRTGYQVQTVFIGGGTPSVLRAEYFMQIMDSLHQNFTLSASDGEQPEQTIEVNPGTAAPELLRLYREAGINRLSIGLQSADQGELRLLSRSHTLLDFLNTYEAAGRAGFTNINVDLMSGLPGQTWESFLKSLTLAVDLRSAHLSVYSLMLEEGTPFYEAFQRKGGGISEEEDRRIYHNTVAELSRAGYPRYEISNYARPGYQCRHNLAYWKRAEYLGFGLGAASFIEGIRFKNQEELSSYLNDPGRKIKNQPLSEREAVEEYLFLSLRLDEGVSEAGFYRTFGRPIRDYYGAVLDKLTGLGALSGEGGVYRLTQYGVDVSNYVLSEFLLEDEKEEFPGGNQPF